MARFFALALVGIVCLSLTPAWAQTDEGQAGVFGDARGGRVTASGEVYDPDALTAGHPSLRFGVRLLVTNPANGSAVTVRVNDRGPTPEGRVVNLSRAAAAALGVVSGDRVQVRALRFDEPDVSHTPTSPPPLAPAFVPVPLPPTYLQLGAFRSEANAQKWARGLVQQGFEPQIRRLKPLWRVYLAVPESELGALTTRLTALGRSFLQLSHEPAGDLVNVTTE